MRITTSTTAIALLALLTPAVARNIAQSTTQSLFNEEAYGEIEAPASAELDTERSSSRYGRLGAVASESKICSRIGTDILLDGGNAADSLVATTLCVGVIGMHHSGIGGGGFMLVRAPDGSYEHIDFRESAPAAASEDMYKNNTIGSIYTGLASGIPGELRGLEYLHKKYGKLPWQRVVMPAVSVARYGFPVTADLVRYMAAAIANEENFLVEDPTWAIDFAPNGTLLGLGDTLTRRRYADTLETIAYRGVDAFYTGPIAQNMIKTIQSTGGIMTMDDLANYTVLIRPTANITYRDFTIYGCTAPTSGSVVLSVMKILEGYPDIGLPSTRNISTHYYDEAMRFAYGQRTQLGDPHFLDSIDEYEAAMISNATAAAIRGKINPKHTLNISAYDPDGFESLETHGTSAIVSADHSGLAISLTTTVNLLFGSHVMVPETGIILNNEMNDFSIPGKSNAFGYIPSPANYIRPGKRPLSSIVPTIVEHTSNGTLYFVTGAAGGSRIITSVLQNLWHVLDSHMDANTALAQPRLHNQLIPNVAMVEYAFDNSTAAFLRSRGVNVTYVAPVLSAVQQIRILNDADEHIADKDGKKKMKEKTKKEKGMLFEAASEPRQKASGGYAV